MLIALEFSNLESEYFKSIKKKQIGIQDVTEQKQCLEQQI